MLGNTQGWRMYSFLVPAEEAPLSKAQQEELRGGSCVCQLPLDGARLQPKLVR